MSFVNKTQNIFGGESVFVDGGFIGSSRDNILGGNNFFDGTGSMIGYTQDNINGGVDIHSATGELTGHTQEFGNGQLIYDGNGKLDGFVSTNGDMTTAFDAAGGVEAMNMGGSIFGEIGLEPDALLDTLATFL